MRSLLISSKRDAPFVALFGLVAPVVFAIAGDLVAGLLAAFAGVFVFLLTEEDFGADLRIGFTTPIAFGLADDLATDLVDGFAAGLFFNRAEDLVADLFFDFTAVFGFDLTTDFVDFAPMRALQYQQQ